MTLLDAFPCHSNGGVFYGHIGGPEVASDRGYGFSESITTSYFYHFFSVQFSERVGFSMWTPSSAFSSHVVMVLLNSPQEKVRRIYAFGNIAPVAHQKAIRDFPKVKHPASSVRSIIEPLGIKGPITITEAATLPEPAFRIRSSVHKGPKSELEFVVELEEWFGSFIRTHTALGVRASRLLFQLWRSLKLKVPSFIST